MRDVGPGANGGDAREQGVHVAVGAVQVPHLRGHPVLGQAPPGAREVVEDLGQQARVGLAHPALEVRDLADRPDQAHPFWLPRAGPDLGVGEERGERAMVVRLAHAH